MARKVSGFAQAMSTPETCRKLLIVFAAIVVALPFLFNMTSILLVLIAAVLTLPAVFLWKYRVARVITRAALCLLMAAVPVLLIVIAVMGYFYTEFFVMFFASALALPAVAVAAGSARRFDIILLRVATAMNTVEMALIIAYIFAADSWLKILLFAAANFCFLVLAIMSFPPDLTPLRKKLDAARAKYNG